MATDGHRLPACTAHRKQCAEGEHMPEGGEGTATTDLQCRRVTHTLT